MDYILVRRFFWGFFYIRYTLFLGDTYRIDGDENIVEGSRQLGP